MKNVDYERLANLFKEMHGKSTPATEIEVKVINDGIELHPEKSRTYTDTFYHLEEVVDFCRVFGLSNYVIAENGIIKCRMY